MLFFTNNFELINVLIFSLLIGSLLNVLIYRIPLKLNFTTERSICTSCSTQLYWYHNIPIFSWIFLLGKCHFCKSSISYQYPLVEFLSMYIAYTIYIIYGITFSSLSMYIVLIMLLSLSFIDFKYNAIPDNLSLVAVFFSFFVNIKYNINDIYFLIILVLSIFLIKYILEKILKKEVLGIGDFYIFLIIANIFNILELLNVITIASSLSLIVLFFIKIKNKEINIREYKLPFVPFLTTAIFLVYFLNINIFN